MSLSVIVITRNEARRIEACLESVRFADEVVVVDSGSSDATCSLARARGANVIQTDDWPGFGPQKNRALDAARFDWVFSIDADERVTAELAAQLQAIVSRDHASVDRVAFSVSRLSSFCGTEVRHGDWYPDPVIRLFRRGRARFSNDLVHERVVAQGAVGHLDGHLLHDSMATLESCLDKMNRYSTGGAIDRHRAGRKGGLSKALGHGVWAFMRSYLVKRGFLDGRIGFIVALSIAEGTYYRYLKMWLLDRAAAPDNA